MNVHAYWMKSWRITMCTVIGWNRCDIKWALLLAEIVVKHNMQLAEIEVKYNICIQWMISVWSKKSGFLAKYSVCCSVLHITDCEIHIELILVEIVVKHGTCSVGFSQSLFLLRIYFYLKVQFEKHREHTEHESEAVRQSLWHFNTKSQSLIPSILMSPCQLRR